MESVSNHNSMSGRGHGISQNSAMQRQQQQMMAQSHQYDNDDNGKQNKYKRGVSSNYLDFQNQNVYFLISNRGEKSRRKFSRQRD